MLGHAVAGRHGRLEEPAELLLHPALAALLSEVDEAGQLEDQRRGEDGVAALEVDLHLHPLAEEADEVDGVPGFLLVTARPVVVDAHDVVLDRVAQDLVEHLALGRQLARQRCGVVEREAVTVAQDVGGVPALDGQRAAAKRRSEHRLEHRLPGLAVLARERNPPLGGEGGQRRRARG